MFVSIEVYGTAKKEDAIVCVCVYIFLFYLSVFRVLSVEKKAWISTSNGRVLLLFVCVSATQISNKELASFHRRLLLFVDKYGMKIYI